MARMPKAVFLFVACWLAHAGMAAAVSAQDGHGGGMAAPDNGGVAIAEDSAKLPANSDAESDGPGDGAGNGLVSSSKSAEQLLPLNEAVVHPYGDDEEFLEKFKDLIENITLAPVYAPIMVMSIKW